MKEILIPKVKVPMDRYFIARSEIYQETKAKTREKFGENSLARKKIMNGIDCENGRGSNFLFNNEANLSLPESQKVILLEDTERIYSSVDTNNFFDNSFYTDVREIILRTGIPTYDANKYILENLVKQVQEEKYEFSSENPLRISGLELVKDNNSKNKYGLLLKIGQDTKIINDKRFAHQNNTIQLGNQTKTLYTKENGLSRVYLNRNDYLNSRFGSLADSSDNGRVVVLDAVGVAPKILEDYL